MKKRTAVITGASRGVGAEIAKLLALMEWNVVILAKTTEKRAGLRGTIYSVANEIKDFGEVALPVRADVRFEDQVRNAIAQAVDVFGGIDALINNASALPREGTEEQLRVVNQVIVDGTRFCTEACLPYLLKSNRAHVINIAPPLPVAKHWFEKFGVYANAKNAVSEYTVEMAKKHPHIVWSTLWPAKMLYTAATIAYLEGEEKARKHTRSPKIMADAAHLILLKEPEGNFWLDEDALEILGGATDFDRYLLPGTKEEDLMPDILI